MLGPILLSMVIAWQPPTGAEEIRITITPQRVPEQAFQYLLLPPLKEKTTGNAVQSYYRSLAPDSLAWFLRDKNSERSYAWLELPYEEASRKWSPANNQLKKKDDDEDEDIPPATRNELSHIMNMKVLDDIDEAARRTYAEWEYLEKLRQTGYSLLLPEVQGIRYLSAFLQIRARLQLMEGNFNRSLYHLQSGMALARHMNETNLVIGTLTGNAIARTMTKVVFEWVQQPGSPNLYWALSDLPKPYFDLRKAYEGDRLAAQNMMADFTHLNDRVLSVDEVRKMVDEKLKPALRMLGNKQEGELTMMIAREYPRAKTWLKQQRWSEEKIERMSATQATLIYAYFQQQIYADELQKMYSMSPMEQLKHAEKLSKHLAKRPDELSAYLGMVYYPSSVQILLSLFDLDREVVTLRCIEAIRHYAANHENKLPARWDDITDLPIPLDPITGEKPGYELVNDHAVITLAAIKTEKEWRRAKVFKVYLNQGK